MGGKCPERWQGIASGSGMEILFLYGKDCIEKPGPKGDARLINNNGERIFIK